MLLFFSILMIRLSLPYMNFETDVAFLRIKQWVFRNYSPPITTVWISAFYIHVFTSVFALIAGFTQFSPKLLRTKTHRVVGALYIFIILFLTGPSGFIMGVFANGGISSILSFCILALLWWYFTYRAYRAVRAKQYDQHAKFMFYSYALTLSAITLRLWKYCIVNFIYEMPPMDLYRLVAWLGWVPNLAIAYYLIYKKKHLQLLRKMINP